VDETDTTVEERKPVAVQESAVAEVTPV